MIWSLTNGDSSARKLPEGLGRRTFSPTGRHFEAAAGGLTGTSVTQSSNGLAPYGDYDHLMRRDGYGRE